MKIQNNIVFSIISLRKLKKQRGLCKIVLMNQLLRKTWGSRPHAMVIRVVGFSSEGVQNWKKKCQKNDWILRIGANSIISIIKWWKNWCAPKLIFFKSQILALFDSSPLLQFSKFGNFIRLQFFSPNTFLILYPSLENSTTGISLNSWMIILFWRWDCALWSFVISKNVLKIT